MTTLNDIKQMLSEEIEKLHRINLYPVPIKEVKIVKARSFYADAWREQRMIRVSYYYLTAPVEEIRGTLMHELLHMIYEAGHGHGKEWKALADKVNAAYPQYDIKRCGTQLKQGVSFSLRRAANIASVKVSRPLKIIRIQCPDCERIWYRHRESNLTLHPEEYRCRDCKVALVRI